MRCRNELYIYQQSKLSPQERQVQARRIFDKFICEGAECELRIPQEFRESTFATVMAGSADEKSFSSIQGFIFQFLNLDWFPR
jgi:hypothetical protein